MLALWTQARVMGEGREGCQHGGIRLDRPPERHHRDLVGRPERFRRVLDHRHQPRRREVATENQVRGEGPVRFTLFIARTAPFVPDVSD